MGVLRRLRFRLFVLMRRNSQPAYYDYGLGDRVQLSAEIIPVRLNLTKSPYPQCFSFT
jgi:hypothetical protein